MLEIESTSQFKKDLKLAKKRHKNLDCLKKIITLLLKQEHLEIKLKDHRLTGEWSHYRELHIEPDWLLIYKLDLKRNTLVLVRTGTHSDLF
ncbi:MAG: type II toxin-antitoxin system YafQ family toxin [Gammaproteobacteria bacterium]|nr:type II toxin-antitoxin system YafQ family toxin [Gammaproteobacteria bacterium]